MINTDKYDRYSNDDVRSSYTHTSYSRLTHNNTIILPELHTKLPMKTLLVYV